jgi:NADPH:quinone reductase-like Zn-dependent oxidoreductase
MQTKEIRFASRPSGIPSAENFQFVDAEVPPLQDGDVLLRSLYISVDPYLRGRMRERKSYVPPFEIGQVIESSVVGEVIDSRSPESKTGDVVSGQLGWRLHNVAKAKQMMKTIPDVSPTTALGVLGVTGLTAYFRSSRYWPTETRARLSWYLERRVRSVCPFVRSRRSKVVVWSEQREATKRMSTCATNLGSTRLSTTRRLIFVSHKSCLSERH